MAEPTRRRRGSVRRSILDATEEVLARDGVKKLSQTHVAKAAGVRQSHLTYYFPKKSDLVVALLEEHIAQMDRALAGRDGDDAAGVAGALDLIARDASRMRFFLGLVVECEQDEGLRALLVDHTRQFDELVARYFGREPGDADVRLFINTLRGCGLMNLLHRGGDSFESPARIAKRFGLVRGSKTRTPPPGP
ncbi:MAG: TetR/AcrR family transcriptional regulator [Acidobacteriota bacterium]